MYNKIAYNNNDGKLHSETGGPKIYLVEWVIMLLAHM